MTYIVAEMCFTYLIFNSLPVLSGVIVMAMLIIVIQLWNHTDVCVSRKAIQKEIMLVSHPLHL